MADGQDNSLDIQRFLVQRVQKCTVHKRQWEIKKKLLAHILKADCGLKVLNAHFKLALPNPGYVSTKVFGQKTFVGNQKKLRAHILKANCCLTHT